MSASRERSPAPPRPPPKEYKQTPTSTSTSTSFTSSRPSSAYHSSPVVGIGAAGPGEATRAGYVNTELAEAVRDSVRIGPSSRSVSKESLRGNNDLSSYNSGSDSSQVLLPNSSLVPPQIRRTPSPRLSTFSQQSITDGNTISSEPPLQPSKRSHGYSHSSTTIPEGELSSDTYENTNTYNQTFQPALPSAQMAQQNRNPFEEDEIEPAGNGRIQPPLVGVGGTEGSGMIPPSRTKFTRAATGNNITSSTNLLGPSSPTGGSGKGKIRRSLSSDSYGIAPPVPNKTLIAGQQKAAEDKKGSRHADLIDTWDPTGMGSAMWHHSGPYDAAAPSRNVNLPPTKAPMHAFNGAPILSPPRTGPTTISLSSPPVVPNKDEPSVTSPGHVRTHRTTNSRRISGGGLGGQYSTSMPTSGGYFPDVSADAGMDEASLARKERQRERENKRRALKAAWGTDTPEPYEDFGASPNEGTVDLDPDLYSPDTTVVPPSHKPLRSPGLRIGLGGSRTPPIMAEGAMSPEKEYGAPVSRSAALAHQSAESGGGTGVKRTKSLMQKIKSMVRPRSSSVESYENAIVRPGRLSPSQRSISMSAGLSGNRRPSYASAGVGSWPDEIMIEEDETEEVAPSSGSRGGHMRGISAQFEDAEEDLDTTKRENPNNPLGSGRNATSFYSPTSEEPLPLGRTGSPLSESTTPLGSDSSGKRQYFARGNTGAGTAEGNLRATSPDKQEILHDIGGDGDDGISPTSFHGESSVGGFVLVESPNSKARALRALKREQEAAAAAGGAHENNRNARRDRHLPLPPPVKPVFPSFDDLQPIRRGSSTEIYGSGNGMGGAVGGTGSAGPAAMKRKPSMVKKLREKMVSK